MNLFLKIGKLLIDFFFFLRKSLILRSQRIISRFNFKVYKREKLFELFIYLSSLSKIVIRVKIQSLIIIFKIKENSQNSRRYIGQNGSYFYKVFQRFRHFLTFDIHMTCMNPIVDPLAIQRVGLSLSYFIIMMREFKIFSPRVNINSRGKDRRTHNRAFYVPTWPTFSPR